jgi:hypothetical protein
MISKGCLVKTSSKILYGFGETIGVVITDTYNTDTVLGVSGFVDVLWPDGGPAQTGVPLWHLELISQ